MKSIIPSFVRPCLWSYDIDKLDLLEDRARIITNILNYGTEEAVRWLFSTYTREEIRDNVNTPMPGEWNRKSLNYWSLMLDVKRPRAKVQGIRAFSPQGVGSADAVSKDSLSSPAALDAAGHSADGVTPVYRERRVA